MKKYLYVAVLFVWGIPSNLISGVGAGRFNEAASKSSIGFCEGNFYYPKSKTTCPQGFNFGAERLPKCLCIKGAYRLYMSNCEVADGFATEVCTLLKDGNITVSGIKLTKQIDWEKTGVVCERTTGSTTDWDYTPENNRARLGVGTFYAINGKASSTFFKGASGTYKQQICVERNATSSPEVCLYKHNDNLGRWTISKTMEVVVKAECPPEHNWTPLHAKRCFAPLSLLDSECQVPCFKNNLGGSEEQMGAGGMKKEEEEAAYEKVDLDLNITDPEPAIKHDNAYFDRKLNHYLRMRELAIYVMEPMTNINHGPNRTFQLYNLMKDIVKHYCPDEYVPGAWFEQVFELFHVLHNGDNFKYENELTNDEFYWIKEILLKCRANGSSIDLYHKPERPISNGGEENHNVSEYATCYGVPEVEGYCSNNALMDGHCTKVPIKELPLSYTDWKKKHYVPELGWLILDIIHVTCFPQFNESYRMFHLLEQTVEKLFTLQIKNYWYYPTWSDQMKASMLGLQADKIMHNLEYCAEAAYEIKGRAPHRLVRPELSKYLRRKRALETISGIYQIQCAKSKTDFQYPNNCPNVRQRINDKTLRKPLIVTPNGVGHSIIP